MIIKIYFYYSWQYTHTKSSSSLNSHHEWLVYDEWFQNSTSSTNGVLFIKRCSLVSTLHVALFAGPMKLNEKAAKQQQQIQQQQQQETNENETCSILPKLKIDNFLNFSITNEVRDSRTCNGFLYYF